MSLYVISDLHIGSGELDDCDEGCESRLVAFILECGQRDPGCELVLAGDSFDFVQADPWREKGLESSTEDGIALAFTQAQSQAKAAAIIAQHPRVFEALGAFLRSPGTVLTLMPGNHDVDLYWPSVRCLIGERILQARGPLGGKLVWELSHAYISPRAPTVWIEHGHQHDPINAFFHPRTTPPAELWGACPPILQGRDGEERLFECVGTRFLIRFLNGLDARYPFVDNIKPFSRFLKIVASSSAQWHGGSARAALSALAFSRFLALGLAFDRDNLLTAAAQDGENLGAMLIELDHATGGAFADALRDAGCQDCSFEFLANDHEAAQRVLDFAIVNADALDGMVVDRVSMLSLDSGAGGEDDGGFLSLKRGFSIDETELLRAAASEVLHNHRDITCVVMGHTHEPVDDARYKNTGSWTRYWKFDPAEPTPSWQRMVELAPTLPLGPRYAFVAGPDADVELRVYP